MADVESLELQITGDATKAKKSLDDLINTLDRLKTATSGGCGLSSVANGLRQINSSGNGTSKSNAKSAKSFVNLGAKVTAAALALKKGGRIVASWINESSEYTENVNLFTVAMGEYANSAKQYAEEVSEILGTDPSDWMRSQGVFMTMATGFGVANDRAATLSQQLTQLGYDISSFYNIDVTEAMTKLRSGLAGELEPLRALGYDLSKAKLEATALSLGIDKAVDSMTQAEKAELRYYAIMTQVTTAQGDMARTLDAPANQLRVLKAQATQAARALGDLFIPALNAILPVAIAVLKVITALAKVIAKLFGADVQQGSISSTMGELTSGAGGASDAIDEATGSAKKLKKTLLGIDELNVMSDTSGGGGSNDFGGGGGFDFELPTYDFIGDLTETRVGQIVEDMKNWLGITDDINSWAELMDTRFGSILKTVVLIGVALASWKIAAGVSTLLNADWSKISKDAAALMGVVGAVLQLMGAWDAWQNGLDWKSLGEQITGIGVTIAGLSIALGHVGAGVSSIIGGIILTVTSVKDWIENGVDWDNFVGVMVGLAAVFGGISVLVGNWIPIAIGGVIAAIVAVVMWWEQISAFFVTVGTAIGQFFSNLWQSICEIWSVSTEWFNTNVVQPVIGFFSGLWTSVSGFFANLWTDIVTIFSGISEWINNNIVVPVITYFANLWSKIVLLATSCWQGIVKVFSPAVKWFGKLFKSVMKTLDDIFYNIGVIASGCWEIIEEVWGIVSDWFDVEVVQPVSEFFTELWETVKGAALSTWESIKSAYNTAKTWFDTTLIQPLVTGFTGLWSSISQLAFDAWEGIKTAYGVATTWFNEKLVQPLSKLLSGLWGGFLQGAKDAWDGVKTVFGKVSSFFRETFEKAWQGIVNVFSVAGEIFTDIKNGILTAFKSVVNGLIKGLNNTISIPFNGINNALWTIKNIKILGLTPFANLRTISVPSIPYLAEGGVVAAGQMFVANEAGPELVGNVGRKTTVMNNDQIVDSVSRGVYQAVVAAMGDSNGDKVVEAKVNDKVLFEVMVSRARQETVRTGYNPLLGGV